MPILVVFRQVIPEIYHDAFTFVFEVKEEDLGFLSRGKKTFLEGLKSFILANPKHAFKKIEDQATLYKGKDWHFWAGVIEVIVEAFSNQAVQIRERLYDALRYTYDHSDVYDLYSQMAGIFRIAFDESIPQISKLVPESESWKLSAQEARNCVLYDDDYYYVPDELFSEICKPLEEICTANQVKEGLRRQGILCTQGRGRIYKTIKKTIGDSKTQMRFVWLRRHLLEVETLDMDFVMMYQIRRKRQ